MGLKNMTKSGAALCTEVKVTGYGSFTCLTTATAVDALDSLKMSRDTQSYACANVDATKCSFSQLAASSPTVTVATLTDNTITFTGTSFPSSADYTAKATFKSASVTVADWTTTSLTATFPNGVPAALASENAVPKIWFTRNSDKVVLIAYSNGVTLANTVTVTASDSTSGLESSFAGGLGFTITKANVFATLKEAGNQVSVCGLPCILNDAQSDATKAVCNLPALATTYSASTFKIN